MTASTDRGGIVHGHRRAAGRQGHDRRHRKSAGYDELQLTLFRFVKSITV